MTTTIDNITAEHVAAAQELTTITEALAEVATSFTCGEADAIANFLRLWDGDYAADGFIEAHGEGDEDPERIPETSDTHYHLRYSARAAS